MTAATAASRSSQTPSTPWSPQGRPSTTPIGHLARTPGSVGQAMVPALSPHDHPGSPPFQQPNMRASSPNYFGLAIQDNNDNPTNSDAGGYARKNWKTPSSSIRSRPMDTNHMPHEANPSLAAFRKQSESKVFQLDVGSGIGSASSPRPPLPRNESHSSRKSSQTSPKQPARDATSSDEAEHMEVDIKSPLKRGLSSDAAEESQFGLPRRESPANLPTLNSGATSRQLSHIDDKHPRLSLPHHRVGPKQSPPRDGTSTVTRSSTLPSELGGAQPALLSPQNFADLLENTSSDSLLLLDVRVSPQYALSRIQGALNLCIPTTLLKRPSYNVQKLLETFTTESERQKFSLWKDMHYIIMYDANSTQMKDATSSINTIKKFTSEGWKGIAYIIRGGYAEVSKKFPKLIQKTGESITEDSSSQPLALNIRPAGGTQVAGGLAMPAQQSAANPFFGTIRQNMDLIGGVGQLPIKQPDVLTHKSFKLLPTWLQRAAEEINDGKLVSDGFLSIEKAEQQRMQGALQTNVVYGTPGPAQKQAFQMAGIEKGTKNRYKDILPFDHTRVKLKHRDSGNCDYINASHIKAEWSNRHYIATQAPIPTTFEDFWRLVWEQDVKVIVMLSAEKEGGHVKCHPYWVPGTYGAMKVKSISEKKVALDSANLSHLTTPSNFKSPLLTPQPERSTPRRQRAVTQINPFEAQGTPKDIPDDVPYVTVRTLALSHTSFPFQSLHEITQISYSQWPDLGATQHPADLLGLVELTNKWIRKANGISKADLDLPAPPGDRPVLVHCSAGCGRTGTFCTVDSVIDMLKQQRQAMREPKSIQEGDAMEVDEAAWLRHDEDDLIAKTVDDFRHQRLSMVQTLRQYVLCYETILEWIVKEMPEKFRRDQLRRSYGG